VFVASTVVNHSDEPKPYLIHSLECQNSAGKTFAKKVFALTNPEEMELLYDAVYHH
jgi:hypothetical protein